MLGVCARRTDSVVLFHCVGEVKVDRESAHQSRDLLEAGLAQPVKETILLVGVRLLAQPDRALPNVLDQIVEVVAPLLADDGRIATTLPPFDLAFL